MNRSRIEVRYCARTQTASAVIAGRTVTVEAPREKAERILRAMAASKEGIAYTRPVEMGSGRPK
jgi:predicted metal-dependent hydrolase